MFIFYVYELVIAFIIGYTLQVVVMDFDSQFNVNTIPPARYWAPP